MGSDSNQLSQITELLVKITHQLDIIIKMFVPESQTDYFDLSGVQKSVYELCDGNHDISSISESVGKPSGDISKALTRLKRKGLVLPISSRSGVYIRTPILWVRQPKSET